MNDKNRRRLNKVIAMSGIASRRKADELISLGRVMVNNKVVTMAGTKVIQGIDSIIVDGKALSNDQQKIYVILNKPFGYISTLNDPHGRPIILDLLKDVKKRIFPVGRLDFDSQGLLILTNDGQLAFRLMHPKFHIPRTYKIIINGYLSNKSTARLEKGIALDDGLTHPAHVRIIKRDKDRSTVRITIFEGRSREIRRMFDALGHKTIKLIRTGYGNLVLGDLKVGKFRYIKKHEIETLKTLVDLH
ncbi:MAG: pseudouridine synthase [Thermodesulfobacteriota bacterium]|nr:pseudouridine synthase [Thermodesulfobacteriota bacterium]